MNRKIFILPILLVALMVIPLASAATLDTYAYASCNWVKVINPTVPGHGFIVDPSANWVVSSITVYLAKSGSPTGTLYCHITGSTVDTPNATVISEALNSQSIAALIPDTHGKTTPDDCTAVNFYFPNPTLYLGNYYAVEIFANTTTGLADNVDEVLLAGNTAGGTHIVLTGGNWANDVHRIGYIVTGTATGSGTGEAAADEFWNTGLGAQIFAFIPTLTSLIIVLMAAFLGWKFAGPWGFFAGINLGYIVSVVFGILPLWGMIALLVVDGLLLFGKVGFRN